MNLVFEALAHPTRRAILEMLKGGSKTAGELADAFQVSKPTMSGHFASLREAGLIDAERDGNVIRYRLNASVLAEVAAALLDLAGVGVPAPSEGASDDPQGPAALPAAADGAARRRRMGLARR